MFPPKTRRWIFLKYKTSAPTRTHYVCARCNNLFRRVARQIPFGRKKFLLVLLPGGSGSIATSTTIPIHPQPILFLLASHLNGRILFNLCYAAPLKSKRCVGEAVRQGECLFHLPIRQTPGTLRCFGRPCIGSFSLSPAYGYR